MSLNHRCYFMSIPLILCLMSVPFFQCWNITHDKSCFDSRTECFLDFMNINFSPTLKTLMQLVKFSPWNMMEPIKMVNKIFVKPRKVHWIGLHQYFKHMWDWLWVSSDDFSMNCPDVLVMFLFFFFFSLCHYLFLFSNACTVFWLIVE